MTFYIFVWSEFFSYQLFLMFLLFIQFSCPKKRHALTRVFTTNKNISDLAIDSMQTEKRCSPTKEKTKEDKQAKGGPYVQRGRENNQVVPSGNRMFTPLLYAPFLHPFLTATPFPLKLLTLSELKSYSCRTLNRAHE